MSGFSIDRDFLESALRAPKEAQDQAIGASDLTSTEPQLNEEGPTVLCVDPHHLQTPAPSVPADSFGVLDPVYWEQANASAVTTPGFDESLPTLTVAEWELMYLLYGDAGWESLAPPSESSLGLNPLQPLPQRCDGALEGNTAAFVAPQPPLGTGSTSYFVPHVPQQYDNYVPDGAHAQFAAPVIPAAPPSVQPSAKPLSAIGRPNEPVGTPQAVTLKRKRGAAPKDRKGKAREEQENVADDSSTVNDGHAEQSQDDQPRRSRPHKSAPGEQPVTHKRRRYTKKGLNYICSLCKATMLFTDGHSRVCPVQPPPAVCPACRQEFSRNDAVTRHRRDGSCKGPPSAQASTVGIVAWQGTDFTCTYPLNGEYASNDVNDGGVVGGYDDSNNGSVAYENVAGPSSVTLDLPKPANEGKKAKTARSKAKN
ncbi:hypothetical protein PC9H_008318 [Pleurotus ostreatus]|uniref:Uncharacterized protein n=1 Tax=Pleurotus ostreatus TaxID=5322 RepID=A0A8H7DSZ7_PLEOS|nr:uncharacterized protein PC9H_008318 [Pleurotus ostreatus]KAF7425956.1 hypothetical protein PC9H_008318 [Pleurotus ostreatus]KAJ8693355.1 hypothetical protein PTI98_008358 [Pleurotus ostreatus]